MKGIKYMKIFEILDEENERSIGALLYYEKEGTYIVELQDDLDDWTAPLLFTSYVKKNIYTIPREISFLWVKERVIPSGRQNISDILAHHKLKTYDEMKFLEISEGRCSQDSLYIKKIEKLPEYVVERTKKHITECILSEDNMLLCFFADDTICGQPVFALEILYRFRCRRAIYAVDRARIIAPAFEFRLYGFHLIARRALFQHDRFGHGVVFRHYARKRQNRREHCHK